MARRDAIVVAAAAEFALHGLHGAPTARIAERAGISHAYLFRFFPTKRDLFIAACDHHFDRLEEAVEVPSRREEVRSALGDDRHALLGLTQALAALTDPRLGESIGPRIGRLLAELGPILSEGMLRASRLTVLDVDLEDRSSCSHA